MGYVEKDNFDSDDLPKWFKMAEELKALRKLEMGLRKKIFNHYFDDPLEGTNTHELGDGYQLVGKHSLIRNIDEAHMIGIVEQLETADISLDALVVRKPALVKKEYNSLTEEQQKIFDKALIIKPGSPVLAIRKKGKP